MLSSCIKINSKNKSFLFIEFWFNNIQKQKHVWSSNYYVIKLSWYVGDILVCNFEVKRNYASVILKLENYEWYTFF